jgi:hypothetical protein
MTAEALTFVSVTFEAEMPLMHLQARSMARFLPGQLAHEILVIDNSLRGLDRKRRARLLDEYGELAGRVRVLRPDEIVQVPDAIGWLRQQVLKLSVSQTVETPHYVVLDAKNHLVKAPSIGFFLSPDGRSRVHAHPFTNHSLRGHLERVLAYLGLPPELYVDQFTSTVTPFVFDTALVRTMIGAIESGSGRPFAEEFVAHQLTEFFLYSGWIAASGRAWDSVFELHRTSCPVVWPGTADRAGVRAAITQATDGQCPFFAVHRRALTKVDRRAARDVAAFWTELGLFDSDTAALRFIWAFRFTFLRRQAVKRLHEFRYRQNRGGSPGSVV